jgi:hypothetical protein
LWFRLTLPLLTYLTNHLEVLQHGYHCDVDNRLFN